MPERPAAHVAELAADQGAPLAALARAAIRHALGAPRPPRPTGDFFTGPAATFITLYRGDVLHGCIGSLEAHRSLTDDVIDNAVSAALHDPRATPLSLPDVDTLRVEVSLLSPQQRVPCHDEASALAALRPGIDGVVLRRGGRRATFLPQVWEALPDGHQFLRELRCKARLDPDAWPADLEVYRYSVQKYIDEPASPGGARAPRAK